MSYLIIFDIKELDNATRLKVNRYLRKLGAVMVQQSVWQLASLVDLRYLANLIKSSGGKAIILRKEIVSDDIAMSCPKSLPHKQRPQFRGPHNSFFGHYRGY
jgi:hypothetical protein